MVQLEKNRIMLRKRKDCKSCCSYSAITASCVRSLWASTKIRIVMVLPVANATYIFCSKVNIEDLLSGSWSCIYMTRLAGLAEKGCICCFFWSAHHDTCRYMPYQSMNRGVVWIMGHNKSTTHSVYAALCHTAAGSPCQVSLEWLTQKSWVATDTSAAVCPSA